MSQNDLENNQPSRQVRRWYRLHVVTCLVVLIVGGALVARNVTFGPQISPIVGGQEDFNRYGSLRFVQRWEVTYRNCGWPFTHCRRFDETISDIDLLTGDISSVHHAIPRIMRAPGRFSDHLTFALVANVAIGVLILFCTAFAVEYWMQHRTGPFQFGLRWIFILTAVAGVFLAYVEDGILVWLHLLFLPIGLGVICVCVVFALLVERRFRKMDNRLSRLRVKYHDHGSRPGQ